MSAAVEKAQQDLADFIENLPPERRKKMEQLQWKIDGELLKYKNPIARMNKMAELFWEGVNKFNEVIK